MTYSLFTDGSHSVEHDIAGMGGYLRNENNETLWSFSEKIANKNNYTKHEECALLYGLQKAQEYGVKSIVCHLDEIHLVQLFNTVGSAAEEAYINARPLLKEIKEQTKKFEKITFKYVPRRYNKKADALARNAWLLEDAYQHKAASKPNSALKAIQHYTYAQKSKFQAEVKKIKNYVIFTLDFKEVEIVITPYRLDITPEGDKWEKLKEHNLGRKWSNNCYLYLAEQLNLYSKEHKNFGFFVKTNGLSIDTVLRGLEEPGRRVRSSFDVFKKATYHFDSLIYHPPKEMVPYFQSLKKPRSYVDIDSLTLDAVVESLKILGQDNYELGARPDIESAVNKKSVKEIQKKYFSQFLKLVFVSDKSYKFNPSTAIIDKHRVDFQSKISTVRTELQNQGISLRF